MKIVSVLLSLYVLTKPFYLWSSGLPQISDIILAVAFIVILLVSTKGSIRQVIIDNKHFFFFLIFVVIINSLYAIYYSDSDFLLHGLYYIFDAIGIISLVLAMKHVNNFGRTLSNSFKVSLIIQLFIFLFGVGRYFDPIRYMGTFNDPNQFAYYCFLSFGFIYLLNRMNDKKDDWFYFLLVVFLIFESASTGMLAGMCIFVVLYLIPAVKTFLKNIRRYAFPLIIVIVVLFGCGTYLVSSNKIQSFLSNSNIYSRIEQKFSRANGDEEMTLWQERGYDHIYLYPYYTLFGAGEGGYWRFDRAYRQMEIHATLPSLLFCYGIIPFGFVLAWLYKKLKGQPAWVMSIYFALLLESFTLINSRQVLFWSIFALAPLLSSNVTKLEG